MNKIKSKKIDKPLSDLLFKLTESEKYGFVEIPENWEVLENNTGNVVCSCGHLIEATYFPYAFDKEENEVHYIGICPICGDYFYICD
jgi:hypothetical protein